MMRKPTSSFANYCLYHTYHQNMLTPSSLHFTTRLLLNHYKNLQLTFLPPDFKVPFCQQLHGQVLGATLGPTMIWKDGTSGWTERQRITLLLHADPSAIWRSCTSKYPSISAIGEQADSSWASQVLQSPVSCLQQLGLLHRRDKPPSQLPKVCARHAHIPN